MCRRIVTSERRDERLRARLPSGELIDEKPHHANESPPEHHHESRHRGEHGGEWHQGIRTDVQATPSHLMLRQVRW